MPDLLLWHAGRRAAKLSEVKGPRDRLSDQQRAWMAALSGGQHAPRLAWYLLCRVLPAAVRLPRCHLSLMPAAINECTVLPEHAHAPAVSVCLQYYIPIAVQRRALQAEVLKVVGPEARCMHPRV